MLQRLIQPGVQSCCRGSKSNCQPTEHSFDCKFHLKGIDKNSRRVYSYPIL